MSCNKGIKIFFLIFASLINLSFTTQSWTPIFAHYNEETQEILFDNLIYVSSNVQEKDQQLRLLQNTSNQSISSNTSQSDGGLNSSSSSMPSQSSQNLSLTNCTNFPPDYNDEYTPALPRFIFWLYIGISVGLCLFAGLMSGLTVGYLSIDTRSLQIKMKNGTDEEKRLAHAIIPILHRHHELLCTLLLSNAAAMEALPVFLNAVIPAWAAVLISTTCVLIFGEILPQAICTGANQLWIADKSTPIIKILQLVLFPIVFPLAKMLDVLLGVHESDEIYEKKDLVTFIEMHEGHHLEAEEVLLIKSITELKDIPCEQIAKKGIFMLSGDASLSQELIEKIKRKNYSRIPIYAGSKDNITGIMKLKNLIDSHKYIGKKIKDVHIKMDKPLIVGQKLSLLGLLYLFKLKNSSLALIAENLDDQMLNSINVGTNQKLNLKGIICLKDIIEAVMKAELKDQDIHNLMSVHPKDDFMAHGPQLASFSNFKVWGHARPQGSGYFDRADQGHPKELKSINVPLLQKNDKQYD